MLLCTGVLERQKEPQQRNPKDLIFNSLQGKRSARIHYFPANVETSVIGALPLPLLQQHYQCSCVTVSAIASNEVACIAFMCNLQLLSQFIAKLWQSLGSSWAYLVWQPCCYGWKGFTSFRKFNLRYLFCQRRQFVQCFQWNPRGIIECDGLIKIFVSEKTCFSPNSRLLFLRSGQPKLKKISNLSFVVFKAASYFQSQFAVRNSKKSS